MTDVSSAAVALGHPLEPGGRGYPVPRRDRQRAAQLLALAGIRPVGERTLTALLRSLDAAAWATVLAEAGAAGLAAAIEAHLHARDRLGRLPAGVAAALHDSHRHTILAQARHAHALAGIAAALAAAAIPFRLLKGLALAELAYPDPTTRAGYDIDLWVRPTDRVRAAAVLETAGLVCPADGSHPPVFLETFGTELQFVPPAGARLPVVVDLHWHLLAPWWMRRTLHIPEAALFARAVSVAIAGERYLTLAPTETLYYLCLHAAINHQCTRLRLFADLALLAQSPAIHWARLNTLAATSGTGVILWHCITGVDALLGSAYGARLAWRPPCLQRILVRWLLPLRLAAAAAAAPVPLQQLVLLPSLGAMATGGSRLLWPPPAWIRLRYAPLPAGGLLRARLHHLARLRGLAGGESG